MRTRYVLGAAITAVSIILGGTAADAATKSLTCYNNKTGAKKVVRVTACPKGFSKVRPPRPAYDEVQVSQAWVKSMETAMPMNGNFMTAAFMQVTNLSDRDITLLGGKAAFAGAVEVHEVVGSKMRKKEGGLLIKAGTTEMLRAGGNHLMFVYMPKKLTAGDEVTFNLLFDGNRTVRVTAPVKATNAGSESYNPAPMSSAAGM